MGLPRAGARIRLDHMPNDPNPIPSGTEGTVRRSVDLGRMGHQIMVDWDNGRTLSLVECDQYTLISEGPCPGHVASDHDATICRHCGASSFEEALEPEDAP